MTAWLARPFFLARRSLATRFAIAELLDPRTVRLSFNTVDIDHSKWKAAVRVEIIMEEVNSTIDVPPPGSCLSIAYSKEGKKRCIKIGNRGGVLEFRGIVSTKVATLRQSSNSPNCAAVVSSDESACRNLVGSKILRHRSTSKSRIF